ncbi:hypothetical protein QYE76_018851 [Lolium multiflorum]|uniref:Uncharacterized protein n=1 Tax=Lolium multiflorum TaxID=4521 RepID=A0AAD8QK24_LOLMU|nr:hypothetical protein QYE76_018851 [Lolium multiflorum]
MGGRTRHMDLEVSFYIVAMLGSEATFAIRFHARLLLLDQARRKRVMMEDNEEEEEDDDGYPNFPEYDDTAEGNEDNEVEDQEAPDEPADDDLGRAIADARRECETEKERLAFDKMIEDHNKLLYPTCEDGHKNLGSTLELLQWKAENGVTDSGFGKLLTIIKRKLPRRKFIMMPVLIQGPKQPRNDIDVYLIRVKHTSVGNPKRKV